MYCISFNGLLNTTWTVVIAIFRTSQLDICAVAGGRSVRTDSCRSVGGNQSLSRVKLICS